MINNNLTFHLARRSFVAIWHLQGPTDFWEGVDLVNLECLFITYPFAFEGKLIQYIGRIARSRKPPVIFDYRDSKIDYFDKMFKQRNRYYKKLLK